MIDTVECAGSKWHYAPMASQLAKAGILTCVIQYSLYPDALAPQMVDELSQALTWTFNNISKHGGDPIQVQHACVIIVFIAARLTMAVKPSLPDDFSPQSAPSSTSQLHSRNNGRPPRGLSCCPASCTSCVLLVLLKVISCTCNTVAGPNQICCITFAMFHISLAVAQWLQMPLGSHCSKCVHSFWSLIQLTLLENLPCGHGICEK